MSAKHTSNGRKATEAIIASTAIEEKQDDKDDYTADDLGLITQNAIDEDLVTFKPVVKDMLQECIKYAKKQQTNCEVSIDLGGRGVLANEKAKKIGQLLKNKGFDVEWHYGDGDYFKEYIHVFCIKWKVPDSRRKVV